MSVNERQLNTGVTPVNETSQHADRRAKNATWIHIAHVRYGFTKGSDL